MYYYFKTNKKKDLCMWKKLGKKKINNNLIILTYKNKKIDWTSTDFYTI